MFHTMGCSCCRKKQTCLKTLRIGSALYEAQRMSKTASGHDIVREPWNKVWTREDVKKRANHPKTPRDFHTILKHPFTAVNKMTEYLYLTGIGGLTRETFNELPITLIINATYEWPNYNIEGIECIRVPVDDEVGEELTPYFEEVSDKIEEVARNGGVSLVHCKAGASRSTSLVLAYLMKYERISLHNAFKSVRKRRETAFWRQLINYEIKTRGKASVKMIQKNMQDVDVIIPDFYEKEYPDLFKTETDKQIPSGIKVHKSQFKDTVSD